MDKMRVGLRLVALRGDKTREEVAFFAKISCKALESYERGYRMPQDASKLKLARYFGVTVDSIFYED